MTKRALVIVVLAALAAAGHITARVEAQQGASSTIVISQVYAHGGVSQQGLRNDFVEIFNRSQSPVNLQGKTLQYAASTGTTTFSANPVVPLTGVLQPGRYFLVALASSGPFGQLLPAADASQTLPNIASVGKLALVNSTTSLTCNTATPGLPTTCTSAQLALIMDLVGYGNANFFEGAAPAPALTALTAAARLQGGCTDTDQNQADLVAATPQPHNTASPVNLCPMPPTTHFPHYVQGSGAASPVAGESLMVRGVVTARTAEGFYVQTPDAAVDGDANSSEGLFVFTSPAAVAVGDLVDVPGAVAEYVPAGDPNHPPVTRLLASSGPTVVSSGNALPAPRLLGASLLAGGGLGLESLEGMRVTLDSAAASAAVVGPTAGAAAPGTAGPVASDGVFYGTFPGTPRPAREAGIHTLDHAMFETQCQAAPCAIPEFDGNPERLRVDSDAQLGAAPLDVAAGQSVSGVVGVLDFAARTATVLPDPGVLSASGSVSPLVVPPPAANQFTVASLSLGGLFDTSDDPDTDDVVFSSADFSNRLAKASAAVRTALSSPDVVGVQEVENAAALGALADQVNADSGLACPNPMCYSALLVEGNDPTGLDVGFLVRQRVLSATVSQEGATQTFEDPTDLSQDVLFDHPPLVLRGVVDSPAGHNVDVAVVVHHLEPMDGLASAANARVAAKRRAQSEFLAGRLQGLQAAAPVREWGAAPVVSLGNDNALDLNDGFVDVVGTAAGSPSDASTLVVPSADLVNPDFENVTAGVYSAVVDGSVQGLDHVLVSQPSLALVAGVSRARMNADFPAAAANGAGMVRLSPRDPAVVYFTFPADTTPPVFQGVPPNTTVEGNTLGGAVFTFVEPSAQDSVDGAVAVSCSPGSGATLPLGTTTVTCSASDSLGNGATASFQVTVTDLTPPQLTLPGPLTAAAASASGAVVTFTATATDVVAGSRTPVCVPVSGSLFPVGATTVNCQVNDGNGNSAAGSFVVTVTRDSAPPPAPTHGSMHGSGHVGPRQNGTEFNFYVRDTARGQDRGWLVLQVRDGRRASSFVSAAVRSVEFANRSSQALGVDRVMGGRSPERRAEAVLFSGTGWWKGRGGYTFEARAEDRGEPGKGQDKMTVIVRDARGAVVHSVSGVLNSGNIQSVPVR